MPSLITSNKYTNALCGAQINRCLQKQNYYYYRTLITFNKTANAYMISNCSVIKCAICTKKKAAKKLRLVAKTVYIACNSANQPSDRPNDRRNLFISLCTNSIEPTLNISQSSFISASTSSSSFCSCKALVIVVASFDFIAFATIFRNESTRSSTDLG